MKLNRENKLLIGLCTAAAILIAKLFSIQILDDKYKLSAENNTMVYTTIYPTRGIINDRNGDILVGNKVAYDLMVTPKEVEEFDTLALCKVLDITPEFVKEKMDEYYRNRRRIGYQSVVMIKQIPPETYMKFAEVAYRFPGFRGQARSIREYPFNAGGNLLGYVSEVNANYIERHPGEYKSGDYAGMTGIEAAREKELRGEKGYNIWLRNSRNKIESRYKDGEMDKEAIPGDDITTTIDAKLQHYGQMLMDKKVGSLVAIEPSTGEILTLVSSPGIDVDQLPRTSSSLPDLSLFSSVLCSLDDLLKSHSFFSSFPIKQHPWEDVFQLSESAHHEVVLKKRPDHDSRSPSAARVPRRVMRPSLLKRA